MPKTVASMNRRLFALLPAMPKKIPRAHREAAKDAAAFDVEHFSDESSEPEPTPTDSKTAARTVGTQTVETKTATETADTKTTEHFKKTAASSTTSAAKQTTEDIAKPVVDTVGLAGPRHGRQRVRD